VGLCHFGFGQLMEWLIVESIGDALRGHPECEDGPTQWQPINLGLRPSFLGQSAPPNAQITYGRSRPARTPAVWAIL
jgi:hypothetical protein